MPGPIPSRPRDNAVCWQCGAPAGSASTYSLLLVANPRWGLSGLGHLVKRGERRDEIRIPIPRCAACRSRSLVSIVITFAATIAGAVIASRVPADQQADKPAATIIGVVLGFTAAMAGIALHRRLSGRQPLTTYPPVVRLRQQGWHFPSDSA